MIDVVRIEDPKNWGYPFSEALYDDPTVVYHGTSSTYSGTIEAEGLVAGVPRIPISAIQELVAACDAVGFRSWSYTTVKGLASGADLSRPAERSVFLSANFWFARDYATNQGGETVEHAIRLSDELIKRLSDTTAPQELADKVGAIQCRLADITIGCFPVVYAALVDAEWLDDRGDCLERQEVGSLVITDANISCRRSVPAGRLLAKVEYINGAESGYLGPQPVTWEQARRWPAQ